MHCPRCGHRQNSDAIRFCTKCGLKIGDVKELLAPELSQTKSKRKSEIRRATRQGMIMIFSGFAVILILAMLRDFITVPKSLFALTVLIFMIGGAIRKSFPFLFSRNNLTESADKSSTGNLETSKLSGAQFSGKTLPEAEYRPPLDLGKQNFDTSELVLPSSVTENTTKLLKKHLEQE